jgi:hypothetical protein
MTESAEEDRKPTAPLPKLKHGQISG